MLLRLVLPPLSISLSQKYHYYFFFFLRFQITILNSPTQFLSLSLSHTVFLLRSLSQLCRMCVCVYGCLAVGLGIAILVGMWPCMYVDVNECNVCSVCMFLVWDFGFTVSYCGCCENGFARSKACHSYSFFFLVFYSFSSHKSWVCGLICAI